MYKANIKKGHHDINYARFFYISLSDWTVFFKYFFSIKHIFIIYGNLNEGNGQIMI